MESGEIPPRGIEFVYYGGEAKLVSSMAEAAGLQGAVSAHSTVPYAEALKAMAACDVLLVLGSAESDKYAVTGKVFEYLGLRKPILALAGPGALADLMGREKFGLRVPFGEPEALAAALGRLYTDVRSGAQEAYLPADCSKFSRRGTTGQLAALMDRVLMNPENVG
jgi:glycosyltransferase involved in cell wall biosynthesis